MSQVFDRILIVMFENQYRSYVMRDPFMRKLATAGANMTNFFGCFHPSQTNYIASLAGEVCAVTNDETPAAPLVQQNLVDLLEAREISWKAYMEGYPGEPWDPAWQNPSYPSKAEPIRQYPDNGEDLARYFRKHNAFASFHTVQASENRWANIAGDSELWKDLAGDGAALPQYSWFTPDIWNDGHYLYNTHIDTNPRTQLIPQISGWIEHVFLGNIAASDIQGGATAGVSSLGLNLDIDLLLHNPEQAWANSRVPPGTLIVVTFDEADFDAEGYDTNYDGPNQIYTVLLGDMIMPGTVVDTAFNHYSLIKTIEHNFSLENLGKNDRDANWFRFLWQQTFRWNDIREVSLEVPGNFATTCVRETTWIAFANSNNCLMTSQLKDNEWSPTNSTKFVAPGKLKMAAIGNSLYLVWASAENELQFASHENGSGWTNLQSLDINTPSDFALANFHDDSDGKDKLMLCWQDVKGFIWNLTYADRKWQDKLGEVGQLTDGPMALAQLGASVFLVYKERNTQKMRITSYNVGPFNAFEAKAFDNTPAPENNTSLHQWAPADFHVGNFAKKLAALQNDYRASGNLAMAAIEGEIHLFHRGAYQDTPSAYTEVFGLTGIFTPENEDSNGFGGLDQAGWTKERKLPEVQLDPESGISLSSDGERFTLVWQEMGSKRLLYRQGAYQTGLSTC